MDSDMAAAEEVEKTEGGNQNNGLKHVHDPENDVVYEGELKPEAPPPKRRAHELPSPFVVLAYPPEEPSLFPHQFTTLSLSLSLSLCELVVQRRRWCRSSFIWREKETSVASPSRFEGQICLFTRLLEDMLVIQNFITAPVPRFRGSKSREKRGTWSSHLYL